MTRGVLVLAVLSGACATQPPPILPLIEVPVVLKGCRVASSQRWSDGSWTVVLACPATKLAEGTP